MLGVPPSEALTVPSYLLQNESEWLILSLIYNFCVVYYRWVLIHPLFLGFYKSFYFEIIALIWSLLKPAEINEGLIAVLYSFYFH